MRIINLFGAPSAGKSSSAAGLFFLMKIRGMSVELVTEYAKELVWDKNIRAFDDQKAITDEQNRRQHRLLGQVDYAITDSPLLLGIIHSKKRGFDNRFFNYVRNFFYSYSNVNFFIRRVKPYVGVGRNETEEESDVLAKELVQFLWEEGLSYETVDGDKNAPQIILDTLLKKGVIS